MRPPSDRSGFHSVVSGADGDRVPVQIDDAARFLTAERAELARLAGFPGVETLTLDFGWDFPVGPDAAVGQYNRFPPALLRACGALGVGIEVSVYARHRPSEEE